MHPSKQRIQLVNPTTGNLSKKHKRKKENKIHTTGGNHNLQRP